MLRVPIAAGLQSTPAPGRPRLHGVVELDVTLALEISVDRYLQFWSALTTCRDNRLGVRNASHVCIGSVSSW